MPIYYAATIGLDFKSLGKMKMRYASLAIATGLLHLSMTVPSGANTVIATCGESSGYRYDVGIPNLQQEGWTEDTIAGGTTTFISTNNGYDVIFKDTYGSKTATEEGAEIEMFQGGNDGYNFIVKYPRGTVVVYSLSASNDAQQRKLLWSIIRNGTGMSDLSGSIFVSDCG